MNPSRSEPKTWEREREFARIEVRLGALVQPLDEPRAEALRREILARQTVWAPGNETALRDMAASGQAGPESLLAQAILELAEQIARLQAKVLGPPEPVKRATIVQLSGGGGRLTSPLPLERGERLELRLDGEEVHPIRMLIRVVHDHGADGHGFVFEAIHPRDQDRLVRLIYGLQRQGLRETHLER